MPPVVSAVCTPAAAFFNPVLNVAQLFLQTQPSCGVLRRHCPPSSRPANSGRPPRHDTTTVEDRWPQGRPDWPFGQPTRKLGPIFVWTPGNWKSASAKCFCLEKKICVLKLYYLPTRTTTCDPSNTVRIEYIVQHGQSLYWPKSWHIFPFSGKSNLYIHTYIYIYWCKWSYLGVYFPNV